MAFNMAFLATARSFSVTQILDNRSETDYRGAQQNLSANRLTCLQ